MQTPKFTLSTNTERYKPQTAFLWISFASFMLTIFNLDNLTNILPDPRLFYFTQFFAAAFLTCLFVLLIVRWQSGVSWRFSLGLFIALAFFCAIVSPFLIFTSWAFGSIYFTYLTSIPALVFPILCLVSLLLAFLSRSLSDSFHPRLFKIAVALSFFFAIIHLWGHSAIYEGAYYDEGLSISGQDYQSIVYYGLMGHPGFIELYQCQWGILNCQHIYESPYETYSTDKTLLLYDESTRHLQLEYIFVIGQDPTLLFDYTIP